VSEIRRKNKKAILELEPAEILNEIHAMVSRETQLVGEKIKPPTQALQAAAREPRREYEPRQRPQQQQHQHQNERKQQYPRQQYKPLAGQEYRQRKPIERAPVGV
jgi:hypothetical protein